MPFNISNFKSSFDRYGGPARANLFEVSIPNVPKNLPENNVFDYKRQFTFFCHSITFPGVAINTSDTNYVGQLARKHPTAAQNPGPISASFFVDSDHHILTFFHNWAQQIVNYSKKSGPFTEVNGKLPHEVGYKNDFAVPMYIRHYTTDSFPNSYYECELIKAYPIAVAPLALDWATNSSFLKLDVQFVVDDFTFSSDKTGNAERGGRGGGLLDVLGDIAGFADTVQGTLKSGRPTSIQDAVNKLTRLTNSFGNLSDNI